MQTRLKAKSESGFTLVEAVVGMIIFLIASTAIVPVFATYRLATIRNDVKVGAVAIAQQVMDTVRITDALTLDPANTLLTETTYPASAPGVGGQSLSALSYKGKTYSASITYCKNASFCTSTSKHVVINVFQGGSTAPVFQLETVYSSLQ